MCVAMYLSLLKKAEGKSENKIKIGFLLFLLRKIQRILFD